MANHELWEILKNLKSPKYKWVDLSHEVSPETPHYEGFPPLRAKDYYTFDKEKVCSSRDAHRLVEEKAAGLQQQRHGG